MAQLGFQGHRERLTLSPWWITKSNHFVLVPPKETFAVTDNGSPGHCQDSRLEQEGDA